MSEIKSPGRITIAKLRRKGAIGVLGKFTQEFWRLYSRLYLRPQFAHFGSGTVIRKPLFISNPGGISIGSNGFVREGVRLEVVDRADHDRASLRIGNNINVEQDVQIVSCGTVSIGDDVCIAARVAIVGSAHPNGLPGEGNRANQVATGEAHVNIGDRVFIGVGSTILINVTIGENSVIGAGSVVTHDIPANSVAVGSPARVVGRIPVSSSDD